MSDQCTSGSEHAAYDVAFEEAVADIITIKALLMDNRPLEALQVANEAEERHKPDLPDHSVQMRTDQCGGDSDE